MEVDRSAAWQSWVGGRFNNFRGNLQLRPNAVPGQRYGPACAASNGRVPCPGGMGFNPGAFSSVPGLFADPTQVLALLDGTLCEDPALGRLTLHCTVSSILLTESIFNSGAKKIEVSNVDVGPISAHVSLTRQILR
jgi:hypothetical protein